MSNPNFKNKDLRGKSFKGQTLTDMDFSGFDLRGADFSGATLTRVKFNNAIMGRIWKTKSGVYLLQQVIGSLSGILNGTIFYFLASIFIQQLLKVGKGVHLVGLMMAVFSLFIYIAVRLSLERKNWNFLLVAIGFVIVVTGVVAGVEGADARDVGTSVVLAVLKAAYIAILGIVLTVFVVAAVTAVAVTGAVTVAGAVAVSVAGILMVSGSNPDAVAAVGAGVVVALIFLSFGLYLGRRAMKTEEVQLDYIRRINLKMAGLWTTNFSSAVLVDVNFEGVDLRGIRFSHAKMSSCNFHKTKNHHWALTANTPLAPRKVRKLVIDGERTETDFRNLDLQGLNFSGMNLAGFDFANSNISFANFEGCNLQNANFAEVTALGTKFSRSTMTGACIKNWNIDKQTEFQDVQCDFVYLDSEKKQCNPPEGKFAPDEFSKLYQQVADTIDFIANNHEELDALIIAIKTIKENSGGADIFVQNIERKENSVIVKVKAPPEFTKEEIYKEVTKEKNKEIKRIKQAYEKKLLKAETEKREAESETKKVVQSHNDLLADLLRRSVDNPTTIINQQENSMRTFSGNNNQNVNIGDITNSTVTQKVSPKQAPAVENTELKAALEKLQALIAQFPAEEQQEAREEAKKLEEAVNQPKEEQESTARKTLRYFKGLAEDLGNIPAIGMQLGTVIAQLALLFGVR